MNEKEPPKWANKFLEWFCSDEQLEVIQGDLYELYKDRLEYMSTFRADLYFIIDVFDMLRPFAIKGTRRPQNNFAMFKNYWKIGWRNLRKEKLFTAINISGLALAITCLAFISLYIAQELSFDKFHKDKENIFRLARYGFNGDLSVSERNIFHPEPLAQVLKEDYPQVNETVRLMGLNGLVHINNEFIEEELLFADPSFFDVFTFDVAKGNMLLHDPYKITLTQAMAQKYFPDQNPIDKELSIQFGGELHRFLVEGVVENIPANSSIQFDILIPLKMFLTNIEYGITSLDNWNRSYLITYVKLDANADIENLHVQFPEFWNRYSPRNLQFYRDQGLWTREDQMPFTYRLQPLKTVHNDTAYPTGITPPVDSQKYYILGGIAVFILLLGCINFTLLSIAKSGRRAGEIGMRKTLGATKMQVIAQFWSESILISLVALVIGIGIIYYTLPLFNEISQADLKFNDFIQPLNLLIMLAITVTTGILAGIYPSLIISSFNPVFVLKNRQKIGSSSTFSKALIVFQFAISTFFIIGALVVDRQIHYMKNKDLGINKEGMMIVQVNNLEEGELKVFKNKIKDYPFVNNITGIRFTLPLYANASWSHEGENYLAFVLAVERNFIQTFDMEIIKGRNFHETEHDSVNAFIVNEAFVDRVGWTDNPIGKRISGYTRRGLIEPEVIGVVKNFNFQSLEHEVLPMIITINPQEPLTNLLIRLNTQSLSENVKQVKKVWSAMFDDIPFQHSFLKEDLEAEYITQDRWNTILRFASIVNIFIACLGLFGFATLYISGKMKEIGIRKIMGGTTTAVFTRIARQFLLLVVIAFIIAAPVGWYIMNEWLEDFAYRIELNSMLFITTALILVFFAFFAISYQFLRTSRINPLNVLKEE